MNRESGPLSIGLLGPLALRLGQRQVTTSAPKQRQVLALLALSPGRAVTVPTLVDELWGDNPPRSYATTLQTYILQLRNALARAAPGTLDARALLSTRRFGYQLDEDAYDTDVGLFDRRVRAGRALAAGGDHRAASEELSRALELWRGAALVDVRMGRVLELEAATLEEYRLTALELRIEADLRLGRHADLLGELTFVAAKHPMNENLCAFLMTALYRAGHVGRSLQTFHRLRSVLNSELGIEPCPRLQRLQASIVSGSGR